VGSSKFIQDLLAQHTNAKKAFPDKELATEFVDSFFEYLFIPHTQRKLTLVDLEKELEALRDHLSTLIYHVTDEAKTQEITKQFFDEVPAIYKMLIKDAEAVLKFDPAAPVLRICA
jgi:serine O-acetyltransferase